MVLLDSLSVALPAISLFREPPSVSPCSLLGSRLQLGTSRGDPTRIELLHSPHFERSNTVVRTSKVTIAIEVGLFYVEPIVGRHHSGGQAPQIINTERPRCGAPPEGVERRPRGPSDPSSPTLAQRWTKVALSRRGARPGNSRALARRRADGWTSLDTSGLAGRPRP